MSFWTKLLPLAIALPALGAAADPEMLNLVMPDATMVMEIKVASILESPIGVAIKDAIHQGISAQLQGDLAKKHPEFGPQIAALTNIDWSKEVQDVVVAGGTAKGAPVLLIVRSSLDAARIQALKAFTGTASQYDGVTLLLSSKPDDGAIAFFDNSIIVAGKKADVQAAIHRRGQSQALSQALTAQIAKYGNDDIWLAATGTLPAATLPAAAASQPGAQMAMQIFSKIAGVNGGLRLSPDFDLSAEIVGRTESAANELAQGLRMLTSAAQSQARKAGRGPSGLDGFKYEVSGKRILLSLHVPEEQVRAGIAQMRTAQSARPVASATAPQSPVMAPSSGLPPPPPGTIRVSSSEGSVLVSTGANH